MFLHIEKHVKTRVGSSLALPHKFFALKRVELLCCLFVSSGLSCVFLLLCLKICRVLEKIIHGVSILTLASFFSLMILIWLSVLIEISFVLYHSYCITFKQLWHCSEKLMLLHRQSVLTCLFQVHPLCLPLDPVWCVQHKTLIKI